VLGEAAHALIQREQRKVLPLIPLPTTTVRRPAAAAPGAPVPADELGEQVFLVDGDVAVARTAPGRLQGGGIAAKTSGLAVA
jgi:hypothetical protein